MDTLEYFLSINTGKSQAQITELWERANKVFSKEVNFKVDAKGLNGFARSLDQATDRVIAFTATTTLLYQTGAALKRLTSEAIQVQSAITGIQSILGATNKDLADFTAALFKIANKTGVSFFQAAEAANEFSRAGLSLEKTLQATAAALGIVRTSGGNAQDAVQGLISAVNSFQAENLGFQEVADKLSALDAAFSTSASGLIQAFGRVGVAAADAGVTFDELGGIISAVKQISGRSEAQIGNSLKAIFVSIQNGKIQELLEGVGVATKDANGEFRTATDVIKDLAEAFKTLTDSQKAFISQKIAGKFQANAFSTLIQAVQGGTVEKGRSISAGADNNIENRLKLLNETTESAIQRINNSVTELSSTLGDAVGRNFVDGLLKYGETGLGMLKSIFEKGNPIGEALSAGISAALTGPGVVAIFLAVAGLAKKIGGKIATAFSTFAASLTTVKDTNLALTQQLATQTKINAAISRGNTALNKRKVSAQTNALRANNQASAYESKRLAILADQKASKDAKESRTQKLNQVALAGSFIVPAITSAIASQMPEGASRRNTDAVGQGLSTALISAAFGPIVATAGAVTGAFQILDSVLKETYGNLDDVNNVVREQIAQNEKQKLSGDVYIQAFKQYTEAIESGKTAQIKKTETELANAAQNLIGSQKQLAFISNIDDLIKKSSEIADGLDASSSGKASLSKVQEVVSEAYKDFGDRLSGQFTKKNLGDQNAGGIANSILSGADISKVDPKKITDLLSSFGETGNVQEILSFVRDFAKGVDSATDVLTQVESQFSDGREATSVAILKELKSRKDLSDLLSIQASETKRVVNANKLFKESLGSVFSAFSLASGTSSRSRSRDEKRFQTGTAGLTGAAGDAAKSSSDKLSNDNEFLNAIQTANNAFIPLLEKALGDNTVGSDKRSSLLKVISETLKEGFNPNDIQEILKSSLGTDTTANIVRELSGSFGELNSKLREAKLIHQDNDQQIAEETRLRIQLNKKFVGDYTKDQTDTFSKILSARNLDGRTLKQQDKDRRSDPNNLSAGASDKSRKVLERLALEGQTGLFSGDQTNRKGQANEAITQLLNANRTQFDTQSISDSLDRFAKNNKSFGFGEGRGNGLSEIKKTIAEAIATGNSSKIQNLDFVKYLDANPTAQNLDVRQVIEDAIGRIQGQGAEADKQTENFLAQNNLLTDISQTNKAIADSTKALANKAAADISKNVSNAPDIKSISQQLNNGNNTESLSKKLTELISKKQSLERGIINPSVANQSLLAQNFQKAATVGPFGGNSQLQIDSIPEKSIGMALLDAIAFSNSREQSSRAEDPGFRGKKLDPSERNLLEPLIPLVKTVQELRDTVNKLFGPDRGNEIIRGGILDPAVNSIERQSKSEADKKEVDSLGSQIEALRKAIEASGGKTALNDSISNLKSISENFAEGVTQTAKIDLSVDVTGAGGDKGLVASLQQSIKDAFVKYYTEAQGKAPVLAPTSLA